MRLLLRPHPLEAHAAPGLHPPANTLSGLPVQVHAPSGLLLLDQPAVVHV